MAQGRKLFSDVSWKANSGFGMHTVLLPALLCQLWRSVAQRAATNSPCRTKMGNFAINPLKLLERWNVSPSLFSALPCEYKSPLFRNTQPSRLRTDGQLVFAEGFSPMGGLFWKSCPALPNPWTQALSRGVIASLLPAHGENQGRAKQLSYPGQKSNIRLQSPSGCWGTVTFPLGSFWLG